MKREETKAPSLVPGTWATNSCVQQGTNVNMKRKGQWPHQSGTWIWQVDWWLCQPFEQPIFHSAGKSVRTYTLTAANYLTCQKCSLTKLSTEMVMFNQQVLSAFTENVTCYNTEHRGLEVGFGSLSFLCSSFLLLGVLLEQGLWSI